MKSELLKRIVTSVVLLTFFYFMYFNDFILLIALILFTFIVWLEFNILILKTLKVKKKSNYFFKFLIQLGAFIYLVLFSYIFWTYLTSANKVFLLFLIGICVVTDIGGLVCGKIFKGKKLTKISPNKTISGLIGSFIFSLVFMEIYSFYSVLNFLFIELIIITLITSSISQLGDLMISYIKRKAKVKNTGELLPGHGGFLDRFDGILFGVPFGILISYFLINIQ
jgi:phosphatidate cytidylyltransferase